MPTKSSRNGTARNNTVVHAGLRSKALCQVIRGKTILCVILALTAPVSLIIGHEMIMSDSAQKTKAVLEQRAVDQQGEEVVLSGTEKGESSTILFEWGNLKVTASGFGAVIMMSSVLFGVLAYMSRPKLTLSPPKTRGNFAKQGRAMSTTVPGRNIGTSESSAVTVNTAGDAVGVGNEAGDALVELVRNSQTFLLAWAIHRPVWPLSNSGPRAA